MAQKQVRRLTRITMLLAMGIVVHYLESLIPLPVALPGFKLGLANIFGILALQLFGIKEMLMVDYLRVALVGLVRGTFLAMPFWLALGGITLSVLAVILAKVLFRPSITMLSVLGSLFHTLGQVLTACLLYKTWVLAFQLPLLLLLAIPTGIATGILAALSYTRIRRNLHE
ncbi:MAG: Gx transporter family protein [Erysipelotrichaceae bacterium]|jgi:heptaprenyl diphosphate synthase|nr:Gx transporter family protein [Erysipelotrichaceae bacterium]